MTHPNEDLLRTGYAAFGRGDMEAISGLFDDDIVWHVPGRSQVAGDYRGKDAVFGFFAKTMELTGGTFRLEVHDVLANDDHSVGLTHLSGERNGKTLSDNGVQVLHIRDGKATESWLHPGDPYATDEFWS
jgi:ketosteroid isomerase-like protein